MNQLITLIDSSFAHDGEQIVINQESLDRLFHTVLGAEVAAKQSAYYTDAVLRGLNNSESELEARSGGWKFHVSRSLAQSAASGTIIAVLLKTLAVAPTTVAVIPAILPYLFQIEKTELSMRDEEVLLRLYALAGNKSKTADELYDSLPQQIRDQVNRLDLLEFLDNMTKTGHAKEVRHGFFQLRHPDHPRFVIHFN